MNCVSGIDLSGPGSPSLIMRDLSEYAALPFLAAFNVASPTTSLANGTPSKSTDKRITYIALAKKVMPMLVDLFLKFKDNVEIYGDGTLEAILSVGVCCHDYLPFI